MTRSRKRKLQRLSSRQRFGLALAGGVPALLVGISTAEAQDTRGLEEIVVTATKRSEDLQRVPISILAFSEETLTKLNVQKFDDFVRYLPSVSYETLGPGQANVYMRGVTSGSTANHSGSSPSVGTYLDEQPITTIQGALDIHIYDIARIEALAGPQGTLYGASSQAGTIRIITNKPDATKFSAGYGLELNTVNEGGEGYLAEGYVNLPLNDRAAVRLVGWQRRDAGYIDNVFNSRTFPNTGIAQSNEGFVEDDYNEVETTGARAALQIDLNDTWTVTPQVMGQKQIADGSFGFDPSEGDLKIAHYNPESSEDRWVQAALTVEGRIANLDLVYAGSYLNRDVNIEADYSDYSYWYDKSYYESGYEFAQYFTNDAGDFINPSQYIRWRDGYDRYSHELRVASPSNQRHRYVAGLFLQKQEHDIHQRYMITDLASALSVTGWEDTIWLTKQMRVDEEWAVFGEFTYDFTEQLSGTVGLRYFETENSLEGFFGFSQGYSSTTGESQCPGADPATAPDYRNAPCKIFDKTTKEDGVTPRFNVTYKLDDQRLVYATYSEGFRPGGINRRGTLPPYEADWLTNVEFGWKTTWFDNRLRLNGALFTQTWEDFQYAVLGANGLTEIRNAGEADITGVEIDLGWAITDRLTLNAGLAFTDSELTTNYCGFLNEETGKPETRNPCPTVDEDGNPITVDPEAPQNTELPITPEWKGDATLRYEFPLAGFDSYAQGSVLYSDSRRSDLRLFERGLLGDLESYTVAEVAAGFGRNAWKVEFFVTNVFDERAELGFTTQCAEATCGFQPYTVTERPRTFGVKFSQEF